MMITTVARAVAELNDPMLSCPRRVLLCSLAKIGVYGLGWCPQVGSALRALPTRRYQTKPQTPIFARCGYVSYAFTYPNPNPDPKTLTLNH